MQPIAQKYSPGLGSRRLSLERLVGVDRRLIKKRGTVNENF